MQITRREFINAASASAMILAGGGLTASFGQKGSRDRLFPIPAEVYSEPLFSMSAKQLHPFIGREFSVILDDRHRVSLILTEVNSLEGSENAIRGSYGECFSMILRGEVGLGLQQGTYLVEAEGLESFSALIVPIGIARTAYEIVINHVTR